MEYTNILKTTFLCVHREYYILSNLLPFGDNSTTRSLAVTENKNQ